jgi:hypothetical protein
LSKAISSGTSVPNKSSANSTFSTSLKKLKPGFCIGWTRFSNSNPDQSTMVDITKALAQVCAACSPLRDWDCERNRFCNSDNVDLILLRANPYDESQFVILVATRDLPASYCRKIDTRHDELIVFCPTSIAFSVALERSSRRVKSPTVYYQIRTRFSVRVISLSPKSQLLPERGIAGSVGP